MGILTWLFGRQADSRERREDDAVRKLSPATSIAAAGANLQATPGRSESEEALKSAAESNAPRRSD